MHLAECRLQCAWRLNQPLSCFLIHLCLAADCCHSTFWRWWSSAISSRPNQRKECVWQTKTFHGGCRLVCLCVAPIARCSDSSFYVCLLAHICTLEPTTNRANHHATKPFATWSRPIHRLAVVIASIGTLYRVYCGSYGVIEKMDIFSHRINALQSNCEWN